MARNADIAAWTIPLVDCHVVLRARSIGQSHGYTGIDASIQHQANVEAVVAIPPQRIQRVEQIRQFGFLVLNGDTDSDCDGSSLRLRMEPNYRFFLIKLRK